MPRKIFANELQLGDVIQSVFLVRAMSVKQTRDGRDYLSLTLQDATGEFEARAWENVDVYRSRLETDSFVALRGEVLAFAGTNYLSVHDIDRVDDADVEMADFFAHSRWPADELEAQLHQLIRDHIRSEEIRDFLLAIVSDEAIAPLLREAPAAKRNHHAWRGGLLEHVVSMVRLSIQISGHYDAYYPGLLNRDLVIAGCVLHDIGKCRELDFRRHTRYSTHGQLVGHIPTGATWIETFASRVEPPLPAELVTQLQHLVLSHHGALEFGSPVTPRTVEAMVLHHVDMIDSRMNMCWNLRNETLARAEGGEREYWSDYKRSLDGAMHFRGPSAWESLEAYALEDLSGPGAAREGAEKAPLAAQTTTDDDLNLDLFSSLK